MEKIPLPFVITCSACQARIKVTDAALVGRTVACPKCRGAIEVRSPGKSDSSPKSASASSTDLKLADLLSEELTDSRSLPPMSPLAGPAAKSTIGSSLPRPKKKGIFTIAGFPVTAKVLLSCAAMLVTLGVASLFGHMMTRSNSPPPETEGASKSPQGVASRPASTEVRKVQPPEKGQADDDWRTSLAVAPSSATSSARGAAGVAAQAKSGPALTVSEIVKKARPSVVRVVIRNRFGKDIGLGSGVIVNASGLVATNYHVVRDAADAYVFLADNTRLEVKGLRGADKDADVAILELGDDPRGKRTYPPIVFSEVEHGQVEQGEAVVAIGHPHGFDMTVTKGIVSAVRWTDQLPPQIRREFANRHRVQWIQTDAAISGGNSGGPLLDDRGRLLGLNTWCDPSGQNLDFAIHEVHVKDLLAHLQSQPGPLPGKADIEESIDLAPEIRQLIVDFRLAQLQFAEELSRQTTAGQRQAYIAAHDPRPQYLDKLKALAAREEKSEKGLHALLAICAMSLDGSPDSQEAIKDASQRILANYVTSTHLELLVTTLMRAKTPDAANLLKQISEKNPNRRIQALATLGEVTVLMADDSQQVQNEAVILTDLDRLEKDYADVEVAGNLLGALAQKIRFEIKNLTVGKIAPEISGKDLDGREMRLSEFHGKVAVLVFWVNWVPPCREIYPQCRQLIEHYEGKPFVLLGVNVDPADDARQVQQSGYIKWRSWGDGPAGPIADQWNVNVYPTTYVLDATGRIRYKNLRGARLEEAVEELLRDAGALLRIPSDLIPSGAAWNYFDDTKAPDANWRLPAFSPTDWPSGKSPLGFGPLEVATKIGPGRSRPRSNSVFFRHTFQMAKSAATEPLLLKLVHSGGAAAYLNGKQVALVNLTRSPKHDSLADELDVSATSRTSYHLIPADCVEDGTNVLAVEVHLDHPERAQATFDATLGSDGVKRLVEQFNGSDSAIRRDVVRIVSKLGGAASAAVPAIVVRLDDKDSAVRADAIRCLGDIGEPAELIMPALAKKVRDENPEVRSWAILSMLRIKPEPVVRHFGREKLQKPDDAREKQALTRVVATAYESLWPQVQEKNKSADQCKKQLLAADAIVLLSPDNGAYMTMQGLAQLRSRKHKDASTTLVAALAKNGPNPVDNAYLSIVRLRQRDRMGAQQLLTESILLLRKENWSTNADAILAVAEASSTFVKEQRAKGR